MTDGTNLLTAEDAGVPNMSPATSPQGQGGVSAQLTRLVILAPTLVVFSLSLVWPVGTVLLRSLNEKGRVSFADGLYFGHYGAIFQDELLRQVTLHSVFLSFLATAITVLLAFPSAYIISRLSRQMSSLMLVVVLMPFWVSIIIRLFAFTAILGQNGIINSSAGLLGLGPFPLLYNTFATVLGMVAYLLPYLILILVSAMASIDIALLSAARTMGASERRVFVDIYFPQVQRALISGTVLVFVLGLGFFLTPAILGGPHNLTIPIFIQQQVQSFQWGKAAAMGIMLLLISTLGYLVALRIGGRGILAPVQSGVRGTSARESLRATPATFLCGAALALVLIILILPLLVVIPTAFSETSQIRFPPQGFTWRWFEEVLSSSLWMESLMKSIRIAVATALVSAVCGLGLARVGTKLRSVTWQLVLQAAAITPLIVPVILLGIGIYDVQGRINLLNSDFGLVVSHTVLCLPLTFLVLANALSSIPDSVEEAAWTMGAGSIRAFWSVLVPSIVPALVGSLLISFVTSWDETVLALFQTSVDTTLPVTIYSFLKSGITPAVSAVAAMVTLPVLVASAVLAVRTLRSSRNQ